jgi:hypothetical protein
LIRLAFGPFGDALRSADPQVPLSLNGPPPAIDVPLRLIEGALDARANGVEAPVGLPAEGLRVGRGRQAGQDSHGEQDAKGHRLHGWLDGIGPVKVCGSAFALRSTCARPSALRSAFATASADREATGLLAR